MALKEGDRVTWTSSKFGAGSGECISDERDGKVLVSVDPSSFGGYRAGLDMHYVIRCATTWLSPARRAADVPEGQP